MKKKNSTVQRKKVKFDNKHLNDPKIKQIYLTFKKQLYSQIKNEKFCLGVSGGPDSLALAFLCKIFSKEFNSKFIALIIDHNLRKQSGIEAQKVKKILTKHKIRAKILTWKGKISKSNTRLVLALDYANIASPLLDDRWTALLSTTHFMFALLNPKKDDTVYIPSSDTGIPLLLFGQLERKQGSGELKKINTIINKTILYSFFIYCC